MQQQQQQDHNSSYHVSHIELILKGLRTMLVLCLFERDK